MSVHIDTHSRFVCFFRGAKAARAGIKRGFNQGIVDADLAVVPDEAQFPEFVHEQPDAGPDCARHQH
jgi:hypothetical protein